MKRIWELVVVIFVVLGVSLSVFTAARLTRAVLEDTYPILLHINDAGGLKKGAPVELAGLEVGKVSGKPYFKPDYTGLLIPLAIESGIKIPSEVIVIVDNPGTGSIVKIPLSKEKDVKFARADDILNGFRVDRDEMKQKGLDDTLSRFEESMKSLDSTSVALAKMLEMLENKSLPKMPSGGIPNLSGIPSTGEMSSFEKTNEKLSKSIDNFDRFILSAEGSLVNMDSSMKGFDKSMIEVTEMADNGDRTFIKLYDMADQNTETLEDFHLAVNEFRTFIDEVNPLIAAVRDGNGLLKTLVDDPCFDEDVRHMVDKMEKHGVMFYPREKNYSATVARTAASDPLLRRR